MLALFALTVASKTYFGKRIPQRIAHNNLMDFHVERCIFRDLSSNVDGGAIYLNGELNSFKLLYSSFSYVGTTSMRYGALYSKSNVFEISYSCFDHCRATDSYMTFLVASNNTLDVRGHMISVTSSSYDQVGLYYNFAFSGGRQTLSNINASHNYAGVYSCGIVCMPSVVSNPFRYSNLFENQGDIVLEANSAVDQSAEFLNLMKNRFAIPNVRGLIFTYAALYMENCIIMENVVTRVFFLRVPSSMYSVKDCYIDQIAGSTINVTIVNLRPIGTLVPLPNQEIEDCRIFLTSSFSNNLEIPGVWFPVIISWMAFLV